jgi:hypothetical protein
MTTVRKKEMCKVGMHFLNDILGNETFFERIKRIIKSFEDKINRSSLLKMLDLSFQKTDHFKMRNRSTE